MPRLHLFSLARWTAWRLVESLALLALLLVLAGCGTTEIPFLDVRPKLVLVAPPPSLLTCPPAPVPPTTAAGRVVYQDDVARYIVDLEQSRHDCASQMDGVRRFVEEEKRRTFEREKPG